MDILLRFLLSNIVSQTELPKTSSEGWNNNVQIPMSNIIRREYGIQKITFFVYKYS